MVRRVSRCFRPVSSVAVGCGLEGVHNSSILAGLFWGAWVETRATPASECGSAVNARFDVCSPGGGCLGAAAATHAPPDVGQLHNKRSSCNGIAIMHD